MSILEDFWYGNIEPSEYDTSSAKEYKEALLRISRNEESLQDTLTDAQRKLFAQYLDSVREFQDMAECLLFQNSFCLGARDKLSRTFSSNSQKIYKKGARSTVWLLTPRLTAYIFPSSRSLQRYA